MVKINGRSEFGKFKGAGSFQGRIAFARNFPVRVAAQTGGIVSFLSAACAKTQLVKSLLSGEFLSEIEAYFGGLSVNALGPYSVSRSGSR